MRDILDSLRTWTADGERIAVATVVGTWGSAPRKPGAKMALTASGKIAGSVSGGCVETAVVEEGLQALEDGRPRLLRFGVADETAWSVGLACGGEVTVFVEPLDPVAFERTGAWLDAERGGAVVTRISGPGGEDASIGRKLYLDEDGTLRGGLGPADDEAARELAARALVERRSQTLVVPSEGTARPEGAAAGGPEESLWLAEVILPRTTLIVVGGAHLSVALTRLARDAGLATVVIEPRAAFATPERFPHVDRLLPVWPREALAELRLGPATAMAVLTHDPKIDDPALEAALDSPVFYLGALGSRRTQAKRRARLLERGFAPEAVDRIRGPIGLDLGAQSPEEIAVAILAEIIGTFRGRLPDRSPGG